MKWALSLILILSCIGCSVPTNIKEDVAIIKAEEQALYDFNFKLIKKLRADTTEDLQKKIDLLTISRIAHSRAQKGLELLAEYLDSTEYIKNEDLALGDSLIELLKKLKIRLDGEETE